MNDHVLFEDEFDLVVICWRQVLSDAMLGCVCTWRECLRSSHELNGPAEHPKLCWIFFFLCVYSILSGSLPDNIPCHVVTQCVSFVGLTNSCGWPWRRASLWQQTFDMNVLFHPCGTALCSLLSFFLSLFIYLYAAYGCLAASFSGVMTVPLMQCLCYK